MSCCEVWGRLLAPIPPPPAPPPPVLQPHPNPPSWSLGPGQLRPASWLSPGTQRTPVALVAIGLGRAALWPRAEACRLPTAHPCLVRGAEATRHPACWRCFSLLGLARRALRPAGQYRELPGAGRDPGQAACLSGAGEEAARSRHLSAEAAQCSRRGELPLHHCMHETQSLKPSAPLYA